MSEVGFSGVDPGEERERDLERALGIRFPCPDCRGTGKTERVLERELRIHDEVATTVSGRRFRVQSEDVVERLVIERRRCLSCSGTGERRSG